MRAHGYEELKIKEVCENYRKLAIEANEKGRPSSFAMYIAAAKRLLGSRLKFGARKSTQEVFESDSPNAPQLHEMWDSSGLQKHNRPRNSFGGKTSDARA